MFYNNVLVTHNDLDGIGCAVVGKLLNFQWVFYASYNRGKYYISQVVHNAVRSIPNIEWIYLADISLSDLIWNEIEPDVKGMNLRLIDHHETSNNATSFKDKIKVDIDLDVSAAKLFYRLFKDDYPELKQYEDFITAVSAYDTWHFEQSPIAKDLQRIYDYIAFQDPTLKYVKFADRLSRFTNYCINDPITNDRMPVWCQSCLDSFYKLTTPKVDYTINHSISYIKDTATVMLNAEDNVPMFEISWYFDEVRPDIKNVIYVLTQKTGDANVSLRTKYDDLDVSKIAEQLGGGGHQKASAISSVPASSKYEVIDKVKRFMLESEHSI